jgi:hypothetical protein
METASTESAETALPQAPEAQEALPAEAESEPPLEIAEPLQTLSAESAAILTSEPDASEGLAAEAAEEIPDWLMQLAEEEPQPEEANPQAGETAVEVPAASMQAGAEPSTIIEETLPEGQPTSAEGMPTPEASITAQEAQDLEMPASLTEQVTPQVPSVTEEGPPSEAPLAEEEIPVSEAPLHLEEQPQPEVPLAPEVELPAAEPVVAAEAEDLSWLQEIADEQAAVGEELTAPAEASEISAPEWVKLEAEPALEESFQQEPTSEPEAAIPAEEIPDWIKGLGEEPEPELELAAEAPETVPAAEAPEAVPAAEAPEAEPIAETPAQETTPPAEIPSAEELPPWLLELEVPEVKEEEAVSPDDALEWKSDELPAWLKEIAESEPAAEAPSVATPQEEELPSPPAAGTPQPAAEILPVMEMGEEAQPEELAEPASSVTEVEGAVQPEAVAPLQAEVPPSPPLEEQLPQAADLAVTPAEALTPIPLALAEQNQKALDKARESIDQGQPTQAVESYLGLIQQNYQLDEIIKDLSDALDRFPVDVEMWVTLGDAYFRKDQLQEALNAYTKAEELAR